MTDRKLSRRQFVGVAATAAAVGASDTVESTAKTRDPRHFILVHGAWHGAWCWYKIVAGLEAAGHRVTAVDLPSGGIDGTAPEMVTLQTQADRVIALLDAQTEPVILVGHSAGGPVISLAAEARPQKIAKLVYLTALLLLDGDSQVTVVARDKEALIGQHIVFHPEGTIEVDPTWRRAALPEQPFAVPLAAGGAAARPGEDRPGLTSRPPCVSRTGRLRTQP